MPRKPKPSSPEKGHDAAKAKRKKTAAPKATAKPAQKAPAGKKASGSARGGRKQKAAPAVILGAGSAVGERETGKPSIGRPSDYRPEYLDDAREMAEAGYTDQQMMDFFDCSKPTFYRWQKQFPEFRNAIKIGKEGPDDEMERSLFHRGRGFEWIEQQAFKVKEVTWEDGNKVERERIEVVDVRRQAPPDSTAAIFWLKNRRGWKDKSEVDHGVTDTLAALMEQLDGRTPRIPGHA